MFQTRINKLLVEQKRRSGPPSRRPMFQTPSERGGIPLPACALGDNTIWKGFKPLQSGAGFLCFKPKIASIAKHGVSNPFRAGRDSSEEDYAHAVGRCA